MITPEVRIERLEAALVRAQGDIRKWAEFADPFYHRKLGLAEDLASINRALAETAPSPLDQLAEQAEELNLYDVSEETKHVAL